MSNNNPASILYDENGNAVGVVLDADGNYRLQVDAEIASPTGETANVDVTGNRFMLATNDLSARKLLERCVTELTKIRKHLASITEEEWDDDQHDEN